LLSFIPLAYAEQKTFEEAIEDACEIKYTIRVYRDENYNHEQWEQVISEIKTVVEKGDSAQSDDMLAAFIQGLDAIGSRDNKGESGIHGDMMIEVSDDKKDATRCGNECPCMDKGICPCTDDANCKG
jgi:hypothetical protein